VELAPGLRGTATRTVTADLTARALGSGDVPVLGTPAVLALIEQAACAAVAGALSEEVTSVGAWAEVEHLAPTRPGAQVTATAVLVSVNGRRLEFTAETHEGDRLVARARHRRVIIDRAKFLAP
jgi:predicted thioesterase